MSDKRRILIADPSDELIDAFIREAKALGYEVEPARTGPETLSLIKHFKPHLLIIGLIMPHIHGIEIVKTIKQHVETQEIGVIVATYHVMVQNYHAAIEAGADYFLVKPFEMDHLLHLVALYFKGELKPDPFHLNNGKPELHASCYRPIPSSITSYIRFWGTRGSNPVSGSEYMRFGGNTSCLEVRHDRDLVIIDAGTGIRKLGEEINVNPGDTVNLVISHTHWDHITGFPFFKPLYQKNCHVVIWTPVGFEQSTKELFTSMLAYAYFPVRLDEMKARITFKELRDDQSLKVGDITIDSHYANHPGPTMGFRIRSPNKTIGYITDNEVLLGYYGHPNDISLDHPLLKPHLGLIEFLKPCDVVVHEAQYFPEEYYRKTGWGHSSMTNATILLKYANCKEWIVTHHDPNHSDHDLHIKQQLHADIIRDCNVEMKVDLAYDGMMIPM